MRSLDAESSRDSGFAPGAQVDRAHHHAEYVGGDKTQLFGSEANYADQYAIHARQGPTFPTPAAHQYCGRDGQYAG